MEVLHWLEEHFTVVLNGLGVIGGLLFTGFALRGESKARRMANLLTLTEHHRDLWTRLHDRPELSRVLSDTPDLQTRPVTEEEDMFVNLLIVHLNSTFLAIREGALLRPEHLKEAVRWLYSRPIPRAVWEKTKQFQDRAFVKFVEDSFRHRA